MKNITIKNDEELEEFGMADFKDTDGLLECIDEQLKKFGLEIYQGDRGDDNFWIKVEEGKPRFDDLVAAYEKVISRELTTAEKAQLQQAWIETQM